MSEFDGTYQNVPNGFVHAFERMGWVSLPHVYDGTHHGFYGTMMKWGGDGEPAYPTKEGEAA